MFGKPGVLIQLPADVYSVALSPDGKKLACGSADGMVRLYDAMTGKPLASK